MAVGAAIGGAFTAGGAGLGGDALTGSTVFTGGGVTATGAEGWGAGRVSAVDPRGTAAALGAGFGVDCFGTAGGAARRAGISLAGNIPESVNKSGNAN